MISICKHWLTATQQLRYVLITLLLFSYAPWVTAETALAVTATSNVTATAAYADRNCAIVNGGVKCWGFNEQSMGLGDGSTGKSTLPVQVIPANSNVTALTVGRLHTCAVLNKKQVKCWGHNYYGELGDGTHIDRLKPVKVTELLPNRIDSIAAGDGYTCILANQGVQCWGNAPSHPVLPYSGVTQLSAGSAHACVVIKGGVSCWGSTYDGKLGNGENGFKIYTTPVQAIPPYSGATQVSASQDHHTCAVIKGGVKCWGYNYFGQLGNGSTTTSLVPVQTIAPNSKVTAIAAGSSHTCAVVNSGVKCWGSSGDGKLGIGSPASNQLKPAQTILPGMGMTSIIVGFNHTCAAKTNQLYCWGSNLFGALGNVNITYDSAIPVKGPTL